MSAPAPIPVTVGRKQRTACGDRAFIRRITIARIYAAPVDVSRRDVINALDVWRIIRMMQFLKNGRYFSHCVAARLHDFRRKLLECGADFRSVFHRTNSK